MPQLDNPSNRRYRLFYLAGMPAEMCGGDTEHTLEGLLNSIMEEYAGQKTMIREMFLPGSSAAPGKPPLMPLPRRGARRGDWYKGQRFVILCSK